MLSLLDAFKWSFLLFPQRYSYSWVVLCTATFSFWCLLLNFGFAVFLFATKRIEERSFFGGKPANYRAEVYTHKKGMIFQKTLPKSYLSKSPGNSPSHAKLEFYNPRFFFSLLQEDWSPPRAKCVRPSAAKRILLLLQLLPRGRRRRRRRRRPWTAATPPPRTRTTTRGQGSTRRRTRGCSTRPGGRRMRATTRTQRPTCWPAATPDTKVVVQQVRCWIESSQFKWDFSPSLQNMTVKSTPMETRSPWGPRPPRSPATIITTITTREGFTVRGHLRRTEVTGARDTRPSWVLRGTRM